MTIIRKQEIQEKTKLQVFNTIYTPILTYGAESWPITSKIQSKITAAEMKFLRGVKNITKRDRIRSTSIREELKQPELFQNIEKKQLQWYGHVTRMEENRIPKRVHEARPIGNRPQGRPQHTWIQNIEQYCNKRSKTITVDNKIAKDRKQYKAFISKH